MSQRVVWGHKSFFLTVFDSADMPENLYPSSFIGGEVNVQRNFAKFQGKKKGALWQRVV